MNEPDKLDKYLKNIPEQKAPDWLKKKLFNELDKETLPKPVGAFSYLFKGVAVAAVLVVAIFISRDITRKPKVVTTDSVQVLSENKASNKQINQEKTSPKNNNQIVENKQVTNKREVVEIVKLVQGPIVYRGAEIISKEKRIIKQWQDTISGINDRESLVIKNQKDWQELWKRHSRIINPPIPLPEVDFSKDMVVAVFMGQKNTSGYGIHISKIKESENNVYIELEETIPSSGVVIAQQFTQPYHIVVVNKD